MAPFVADVSAWRGWEAAGVPLACNGTSQFVQNPAAGLLAQNDGQDPLVATIFLSEEQQQGIYNGHGNVAAALSSNGETLSSAEPQTADNVSMPQEAAISLAPQDVQQQQQQQLESEAVPAGISRDQGAVAVLEPFDAGAWHAIVNGHERPSDQQLDHLQNGHELSAVGGAPPTEAPHCLSLWEAAGPPAASSSSSFFILQDPVPPRNNSHQDHQSEGSSHQNGLQNGHHSQSPLSYDISSDLSDDSLLEEGEGVSQESGVHLGESGGAAVLLEDVHVVTSRREAARVAQLIADKYSDRWFAVDTEVRWPPCSPMRLFWNCQNVNCILQALKNAHIWSFCQLVMSRPTAESRALQNFSSADALWF